MNNSINNNMIPKISFEYSSIYDDHFKKYYEARCKVFNKKIENYPSSESVLKYMSKAEKIWNKHSNSIINEISNSSKLKWKSKAIKCYFIGWGINLSDPLTISTFNNIENFIHVLTHELIHQILFQNEDITSNAWKFLGNKYKNESQSTRAHIIVHAIHSKIYLKLFNKKYLELDIKQSKNFPEYKKSWDIIKKEGADNIIKEFNNHCK